MTKFEFFFHFGWLKDDSWIVEDGSWLRFKENEKRRRPHACVTVCASRSFLLQTLFFFSALCK
jgi:hypothetical protein